MGRGRRRTAGWNRKSASARTTVTMAFAVLRAVLRASVPPWWSFAAAVAILAAQGCGRAGLSDSPEAARLEQYVHAPPLVWWSREARGREVRNFLGFLYHQVSEKGGRRRAVHFIWPLGMSSVEDLPDGETRRVFHALPFLWRTRLSEPSGAGYEYYQLRLNVLGPIFSLRADNYGEGYVNAHFLWPLGQYFRGEKRLGAELRKVHSFRLLPFVQFDRSWRPGRAPGGEGRPPGAGPSPGGGVARLKSPSSEVRLDERRAFRFLHLLLGMERDAGEGVTRIYLVGGSMRDRRTGRRSMVALWGLERGPSTDREHQLLWRFFVLRRSGAPRVRRTTSNSDAQDGQDGERQDERGHLTGMDRMGNGRHPVYPVDSRSPSDRWRLVQWMFRGSPRVAASAGPVFSYRSDWEADTKRVSVLTGLFSYNRVGLKKSGRILWFIPWRGRKPKPISPAD